MGKKKFYINEEGVIEVTPFFDKQVKKNIQHTLAFVAGLAVRR